MASRAARGAEPVWEQAAGLYVRAGSGDSAARGAVLLQLRHYFVAGVLRCAGKGARAARAIPDGGAAVGYGDSGGAGLSRRGMGQTLEGAGSRARSTAAGMVDRLFCVSARVVCGDAGAGDLANLVGSLAGVGGVGGRHGGGGSGG